VSRDRDERDAHPDGPERDVREDGEARDGAPRDWHDEDHLAAERVDPALFGRMLQFAWPFVVPLAVAVGLLFVSLGLRLAGPEVFKRAIDGPITEAFERRGDPGFDPSEQLDAVTGYAMVFLVIAGLGAVTMILKEWLMNRTGQRIVLSLRTRLFDHVLRLPVSWFDRKPVGWVVTRVTSDVDTLNELFSTGLVSLAYDVVSIVVILGVLVWISPVLALTSLVVLPVMVLVSFRFRLRARNAFRKTRASLSRLNAFLQERLTGLAVVQLFRRERSSSRRFAALNRAYWRDLMETVRHFSAFFPVVDGLSLLVLAGTVVHGYWLIDRGAVTVGEFVQFWMYLTFVFEPIRELAERYNILQAAMAAGERIFGIFDEGTEDGREVGLLPAMAVATGGGTAAADGGGGAPAPPAPTGQGPERGTRRAPGGAGGAATDRAATDGAAPEADGAPSAAPRHVPRPDGPHDAAPAIEFEHVSFAYPGGPYVIHDLSFRVREGERVAIVGHTGAGKTTITALLSRFHETPHGTVRVFGRDVCSMPHAELRSQIAVVQQDVFLFSDTIAANIRMGDDTMRDERVREMARAVHADRFIERLPRGYETPLAERGGNLSTGQRQLIAFARALAADPRILVLDEATSSVDSESEELIEEATARLMQGRTSLVIAHRLSTIVGADRILVMHKGELREQGTHEELLASKGLYWRLYQLHLAGAHED